MWITIKSDFFSSPFDCVVLSATLVAITDIHEKESKMHIINIEKQQVVHSLCKSIFFTAICSKDQSIIISDHKNHWLYEYNTDAKALAILLGDPGKYGYEDGPPEKGKLVSPVGLCFRGWTLYIAENPLDFQGSIRVYSKLTDLIYFKQV